MQDSKAPRARRTDPTRSAESRRATLERRNARAIKRAAQSGGNR